MSTMKIQSKKINGKNKKREREITKTGSGEKGETAI